MTPLLAAVPVGPDGPTGRDLLRAELAKAPYAAARPTLFDRAAEAFLSWFGSLFDTSRSGGPPALLLVVLVLLVVAAIVVALLLFGLPRRNRRSGAAAGLFGEEDRRTADDLRGAAEAALAAGDPALAVLERFRAVARGLDERTLVAVFPGTTAAAFACGAAGPFPAEAAALAQAAALFDAVRYAGRGAGREDALAVAALDDRLAAARPRTADPVPA